MRIIRQALTLLNIDPDRILKHNSPRILYCMEVMPGAKKYFLGFKTRKKITINSKKNNRGLGEAVVIPA